jgi:tyramine---L-glutamate ligase
VTSKVVVLEFLCGGGIQADATEDACELDQLLQEGWGMLHALSADLIGCGLQVETILSPFFEERFPDQARTLRAMGVQQRRKREFWLDNWCRLAKSAETTVVIAPEIDGHLTKITRYLRANGAELVLPTHSWLSMTGDKWNCNRALGSAGIRRPKTSLLKAFVNADKSGIPCQSPYVLKRRMGAGGLGTRRFQDSTTLIEFVKHEIPSHLLEDWLVQEHMDGQPASLAAVIHDKHVQLLGAMIQRIEWQSDSPSDSGQSLIYLGGEGPIPNLKIDQVERFAGDVLRAVENQLPALSKGDGARGWIGIDFIIPEGASDESEWYALEINSRLTTSYLGYRQWYGPSIARALIDPAAELPSLPAYADRQSVRFDV